MSILISIYVPCMIVPTDNALAMIETVLGFNGFGLGEKNYRQTDGIAIGSRLGRNFACAYMRKWDEKLLIRTQTFLL